MELSSIVGKYGGAFLERHSFSVSSDQLAALNAIGRCRSEVCGEIKVYCPKCFPLV
ncbi:MAG: hypothetical protein GY866_10805 [Proteobacteria bacterium]|nr:hypothetical protein [Pseudomonadota bacterium]